MWAKLALPRSAFMLLRHAADSPLHLPQPICASSLSLLRSLAHSSPTAAASARACTFGLADLHRSIPVIPTHILLTEQLHQ